MSDDEEINDEPKIDAGWDRSIDFVPIKEKLLNSFNKLHDSIDIIDDKYEKRTTLNKLIYIIIALIQLRNGSRISEASTAMLKFMEVNDLTQKVIVKIAKSEGIKYNNRTKERKMCKARYRKIMFPVDWIDENIFDDIKGRKPICLLVKGSLLRQRVRDYLRTYFDCNTHSLRYACINYLLSEKKLPMNVVSKYVGHSSVNQLVTYTQHKNVDGVFDLNI